MAEHVEPEYLHFPDAAKNSVTAGSIERVKLHSGNPGHAQKYDFPGTCRSTSDLPHFGHEGGLRIFEVMSILCMTFGSSSVSVTNSDGLDESVSRYTLFCVLVSAT